MKQCAVCKMFIISLDPEEDERQQAKWDKVMGWTEDGTGVDVCEPCFNQYIEWYRKNEGMKA